MFCHGFVMVYHGFIWVVLGCSWVFHGLSWIFHGFIMDLSLTLMVNLGFSIMIVGKSGLWEIKPWEKKKHKPIGFSYDGFSHGFLS